MKRIRFSCCALCAFAVAWLAVSSARLSAQEPIPQKPSAPADATKAAPEQDPVAAMQKAFADAQMVVDVKAQTITMPCVIGQPADPIEFLLVHERGKTHEALFVTKVKASLLNGAFLLLGYEPGKNARSVERVPLPTPEEVAKGAPMVDIFPPEGMKVWFTAKWKRVDDEGNEEAMAAAVEDMILDLATERSIEDIEWIYLGGNMAPLYRNEPPVFIGDYEGNLASTIYRSPPNHLVTAKHSGADDDERWWLTELVPPPGTEVTLTIHRQRPQLVIDRDQRIEKRRAADAADKGKDVAAPPQTKR
jgi:hypothetical protein